MMIGRLLQAPDLSTSAFKKYDMIRLINKL